MTGQQVKEAHIYFTSNIVPETTRKLSEAFIQCQNQQVDVVHLMLSSPGGGVYDGINLHNLLRSLSFRLVTYNMGSVNSIGNNIFLAGDERHSVPSGTFMFHGIGQNVPEKSRLEMKTLREKLDSLRADQDKMIAIINERAGFRNKEEIESLFEEQSTKSVSYAKSKGLIHNITRVNVPKGSVVNYVG